MFRTALISMFLTSTALADTWTVDDDGKADFDNIQAAVDASSDGDEIIVMPGTYTSTQDGHVVNMLGKAVTLRSSDPSDPNVVAATIIDGEGVANTKRRGIACFNGETNKTVIEGLTITNGTSVEFDYNGNGDIDSWEDDGGGMYIFDSSPMLTNCTFEGNYSSSDGGGISSRGGGNPTLTNCTFDNNFASANGGGMYNGAGSNPTLDNCTFTNNIAYGGYSYSGGGGMWNHKSSPTLTDCTFSGNTATRRNGGGMCNLYGSPTFTNCTFEGNSAVVNGGGMFNRHANPTLTNCTFENNAAEEDGGGMANDNSSPTLIGCTLTDNTAGEEGGGMRNYNETILLTDTTVCGNIPDQIYGVWTDGGGSCVVYSCEDNNGDDIPDKCTNGNNTILVPEEYATIQDAINVAVHGDEIIIGPGTYTGVGSWVVNPMGKRLWIHSSDGPEVTIIDGEGTRRGILCENGETSDTTIEGLTITNGYASEGGGMYNNNSSLTLTNCTFTNNTATSISYNDGGGGMCSAAGNPTVENCTFTNNTSAARGGGMYGSLTLTNCTFENNTATYGGGMCGGANTTLTNCTFTNNTAANYGGGMYTTVLSWSGNTTLTDCTFSGNSSGYGGGMYNFFIDSLTLENCTFTDNTADYGGGMGNSNCSHTLENCTFTNNTAYDGGGTWNNSGSTLTATGCTFENNTADNYGGGIYKIGNGDLTLDTCAFSGNSADQGGDGIYSIDSGIGFIGTNTSDELYIDDVSSLAFSAESTCDVTGSTILSSEGTIYFDINDIDTSSSLNVSQSIFRLGGLVVSNNSGSLLEATEENVGDIIPLAQASALIGNFDSIVFPPMPEGLGLQLINPALRGGDTEVAAEVIEIEGANFGDPFSGDLDSPPIDIISFDADGDGRDEVAVLFGGTPGGVACYSVSEDGTPTLIDGYAATLGDDPVGLDAGDLNGDGLDDLLVVDGESATLSILVTEESGGSLTFVESTFKGSDMFTCVSMIDWGGDSALDAVVGVTGSANGYQIYYDVSLFASIGPWLEIPEYQLPDNSNEPDPPTCVDGGDQNSSWGFVGGTRYGRVHRATPGGSLQVIAELAGNNTVTIEAIELDANGGDGQIDLMVSSDEAEVIYLFQGNAAESDGFDDLIPLGVSLPVEDIIALDADGDGDMDIVMTAPDSDTPVILLRNDGASGGLLPSSLGGQTWSMQIINSASDVTRIASGGLEGKDDEDDWIVGGGSSTGFRGETIGVIEQSNILLGSRCDADISGDGEVNVTDLLAVIDQWGSDDSAADINGDGIVNVTDLLEVVGNWGPCE